MADKTLSPEFIKKMENYTNSISNNKYIIEVSKFCGYSEFLIVFKNSTLIDLYNNISYQFDCSDIKGLYIRNEQTMCKGRVPLTQQLTIREFIAQINNNKDDKIKDMLKPVYPLPDPVVYRIYLDDGHCHCICHNENP